MNMSMQQAAHAVIVVFGIGWLTCVGSSIILPLIFAAILALFMSPLAKKIFKFVKIKWLAIFLSFLVMILPVIFISLLFSFQLINIVDSLPSIGMTLENGMKEILGNLHESYPYLISSPEKVNLSKVTSKLIGESNVVGQSIISSTNILANTFLTFIYTFFLLYYKNSFKNFIIYQFDKSSRPDVKDVIFSVKQTIQSYIGGLGIVIIFLSVVNTIGLYIIGIEYPLFWGAFAGLLAVIPYIGTALGGFLPFLYSIATTDDYVQPVAIIIYYIIIQAIEGNIITPKIVGDKININPLFAIVALLFFGSMWGIGGVVLALPLISILRIILSHFEETEAIAVLMSSNVSEKNHKFSEIAQSNDF